MPTRRTLLAAALSLAAAPALAASSACGSALLKRAMARMGGADVLAKVTTLHWTGSAKIFAGDRVIEIGASTTVRPFQSARSDTWLRSEGPTRARSLIIEDGRGFLERNGQRTDMPAAMLAHETQQYALYGLMLLAPLCAPGAEASLAGDHEIEVIHPKAPRTVLSFDAEARLVQATNRMVSPDQVGGPDIDQVFDFSGEVTGGGVRWPRIIAIRQNGAPYFELTIETFEARA